MISGDNANTFVQGGAVANQLRAFPGLTNMTLWMIGTTDPNDGGQGMFYWSASSTAADDGGITTLAPHGYITGRWLRQSGGPANYLNLVLFGGDSTGVTASDVAWSNFAAAVLSSGIPGYIPPGNYTFNNQAVVDYALTEAARSGAKFFGVEGRSVLNFSSSVVAPALLLTAAAVSNSAFYGVFKDISINADCPGPAVAICPTDHSAAINGFEIKIQIANADTSAAAVGLQVNGAFNCNIWVTANNGNHGDAIQATYMAFCSMWGAGGHCDNALHLTDFFVFGNVFQTMDYEVCNTCVVIDSVSAARNTWLGGQFVSSNGTGPQIAAINATEGNQNRFLNCNFGDGPVAVNSIGILIPGPSPIGTEVFAALAVAPTSGDGDIVLVAPGAGDSALVVMNTANSNRWTAGKNNAAESGANAGSDYLITRFDDMGNSIDNPIAITRATGAVSMPNVAVAGGIGGSLSFYGASLQTKPTVTGAKGGNAALAGLLTTLATLGLLTDATT